MSDLSRVEQLLRNALGEDIYEVTPQSRVEVLLAELNELIEGMGGGSVSPEDIATAVAAYLDEHLTNPTSPPVDTSLAIAGAAADAKKTGDEIGDLKEDLNHFASDEYDNVEQLAYTSASNLRLNEFDGLSASTQGYKLVKYAVTAGEKIRVDSDDRFQFQTVESVPSSGTNNRVGITYGEGDFYLTVPENATRLIISTPTTSNAHVYNFYPKVSASDVAHIYANAISTVSEKWCEPKTVQKYTSSTFSGFSTSWDIAEDKHVRAIKFKVRSREETNITEIRVRIESDSFMLEKSISVNIGATLTEVTFPVGMTIPAGTVWIGICANKKCTFLHTEKQTAPVSYDYMYWTNGDMNHLYRLKDNNGALKKLYIVAICDTDVLIKDGSIGQNKLSFSRFVTPTNLFDVTSETMCKKGYWYFSYTVGGIMAPEQTQYTSNYTAITVPVYDAEKVTVGRLDDITSPIKIYWIGAVDENMRLLSYQVYNNYMPVTYIIPDGAKYLIASVNSVNDVTLARIVVEKGELITEESAYFEPYYILKNCAADVEKNSKVIADFTATLKVPSEYALVVGDTFELFWKGVINAIEYGIYNIEASCTIGSVYARKFVCTPTATGTYPLTIRLKDYTGKTIDSKVVNLVVSAKATSPNTQKNVLCVGNSLTTGGIWPKELYRRLTGAGGTPEGDGLTNINFIGTRDKDGVHFEGYGGWKFSNYNTAYTDNNAKVITCVGNGKTDADQHSIYKDSTNATWKLETIETNSIKIIAVSGEGSNFPSSGTLTWVSGGVDHSDIVYTASASTTGNPFWNNTENAVDFAWYARQQGVDSIDFVYVLLGWNNAGATKAGYKTDAQTFIDNVQADFPNAKIVLVGLQIPARDGLGVNYGASGIYSGYWNLMQFVFNLDEWYEELAEENENVYHINLAGQFDTEYSMPTMQVAVNVRNATTITQASNGVHPATSGYLQIADAVYRDINARL